MKTIFITSFNPFISRNILETDVLKELRKKKDLRIVIFVPDYKKDFFCRKFVSENIIIETIKTLSIDRQDIIFRFLTGFIINTKRLRIRHLELLDKNKKIVNFILSKFLIIFGYLPFVKKIIQRIDFKTISKTKFESFFNNYKPDLVFSTDIFHNDDVHFLAEAKRRKIKTIGMVRSWDNITNKGLFRIKPDKLIVHNNAVKLEAIRYENILDNDIFVSGIPQFDYYFKDFIPSNRNDFFKRIGLDENKKTILVAPHGKRFHNTDWQLLDILKKELPKEVQFIVRFPPNDTIDLKNFESDSRFFIEKTGVEFPGKNFKDNEVEFSDTKSLTDDLYHSDLVINYGSTISIDAVVFDKPVIIVAFDGYEKLPYIRSVIRFLDYNHVISILKTGFCKIAKRKEDLIKYIHMYLSDSSADSIGRKILIEEQIYNTDGNSGKRIANYINSLI
jgi:CDP-glycerol glycerophosphotransferase (TagB/SpsB family)